MPPGNTDPFFKWGCVSYVVFRDHCLSLITSLVSSTLHFNAMFYSHWINWTFYESDASFYIMHSFIAWKWYCMIVFNTNILDVNKDDIAVTKTEYRGWTQMQLLKHPRSPPGFSSVAQSLVSCEHILSLSFVLSVALRFTASTRRFGIVKLFL